MTAGRTGAAAGTYYVTLLFQNTGSAACTLYGYPGVSYVAGSDGHQVGGSARRDNTTPKRVVLSPGERASTALGQARPENYPTASCRPTATRGIRVYPPGQRAAAYVAMPGKACSNPSVDRPTVSPVEAGTMPITK